MMFLLQEYLNLIFTLQAQLIQSLLVLLLFVPMLLVGVGMVLKREQAAAVVVVPLVILQLLPALA
jgi:hypothetical protein